MSRFSEQGWSGRYGKLGDEAEGIFEATYPKGFARYGLNRPDVQVAALPLKIRYTPDYLTSTGLVEVQGFGRNQELHMKVEKYTALNMWAQEWHVDLFLWDSHKKRYATVPLDEVTKIIASSELGLYPEGKPYFKTPIRNLEAEWTKHDPAVA